MMGLEMDPIQPIRSPGEPKARSLDQNLNKQMNHAQMKGCGPNEIWVRSIHAIVTEIRVLLQEATDESSTPSTPTRTKDATNQGFD